MDATVSEIHQYPLRPPGYEESLFPTAGSKRAVAEHLLGAPWLHRAAELGTRRGSGQAARATDEPVYVLVRDRGSFVVRSERPIRGSSWRKRRIVEIVDLWREVRSWWRSDDAVDRLLVRVVLSGGAVVDLARNRRDEWSLIGVAD